MSYEFTAPIKDPQAQLFHAMDWSAWLETGETLMGLPTVVPSPAGLAISEIAQVDGVVSWKVAGGALGQKYIVTVGVTTSLGRSDQRSIQYTVGER